MFLPLKKGVKKNGTTLVDRYREEVPVDPYTYTPTVDESPRKDSAKRQSRDRL